MSHIPKVLEAFRCLLGYPDQHTTQAVELLYVVLQDVLAEAARGVADFGEFCEQHELWKLEETYTRTFDVNPACALEVGWHLFGEEYARGMFLVRMRQEMRKYGLSESVELPDHLSHVLAVVAAMPEEEATRFVRACVQPAVEKMNHALTDQDTPYRYVLAALVAVLTQRWGACATAGSEFLASNPPATDPLRAYPVAEVRCGGHCGGSCESHVVPLDTLARDESNQLPVTGAEGPR